MKIVICDDQKAELEDIKQIVAEYAEAHLEFSIAIKCFDKPFEMLDEIDRNGVPDIALLDICMPGVLGTEIARELLKRSENSTDIIFLTSSHEFAVEAFALHANDYLTKPYTKERLTETLEKAVERRRRHQYIPIQCGNEIHRVDLDHVIYVESKNHRIEIHLKSGRRLETRTTLTELKELFLGVSGFAMIGVSYIVNFRYVQSLLPTTMEMVTGETIPVPRRLRTELKKQYFDFCIKEAIGK